MYESEDLPAYRADPSWPIEKTLAWLKRREYLRTHRDAWIPESNVLERGYHHWWHTKGKYYSLKHYTEGAQEMH
jgi:hypothetical protein